MRLAAPVTKKRTVGDLAREHLGIVRKLPTSGLDPSYINVPEGRKGVRDGGDYTYVEALADTLDKLERRATGGLGDCVLISDSLARRISKVLRERL